MHGRRRLLQELEQRISRGVLHPVGILDQGDLPGPPGSQVRPRGQPSDLPDADRVRPDLRRHGRRRRHDALQKLAELPGRRQLGSGREAIHKLLQLRHPLLHSLHARIVGVRDPEIEPSRELSHCAKEQVQSRRLPAPHEGIGGSGDLHVRITRSQEHGLRVGELPLHSARCAFARPLSPALGAGEDPRCLEGRGELARVGRTEEQR